MSHRRAKKIRMMLLLNPRREVGGSRGRVVRALTDYEIVENSGIKNGGKTYRLVLKPFCPKAVIQRAKRYANK